ncbi:MAG: Gfo/Idh/MocA family oxidoreductase [Planctomycetes bacterium]|nr:Gfo/Idh/MocA family oxidoreductase [Planctomycetota bacterium]MBL7143147.1 Gfo/Idh/MocA family oxidoreductase [Phycisphaerae bacterium]
MNTQKIKDKINRRSFLHSAAGVGAGLVFSPIASSQEKSSNKPDDINVALLGAGEQGWCLMNVCLKIPGIRFKAVCDIWTAYNQKRASRLLKKYRYDHNTYTDYRDMLDKEKDLDAVIVATPDFWHSPHTVACLEAGLHVYCETAMSNTVEDAAKMVKAVRRTGKLLQIGCQRRSNPRYLYCYDKLMKGRKVLGRVAAVSGQWNRVVGVPMGWPRFASLDRPTLERYGYESMAQFRNWRWYKGLGGGPVVSLGSHQIDVINWFLGTNPISVMASGRTSYLDKKMHQWYDTMMAVYEYETDQGPICVYYQILSHNRSDGCFERFFGEQGTLELSETANRAIVFPELMNSDNKVWARSVKEGCLVGHDEMMKMIDKLTVEQVARIFFVEESLPLPPIDNIHDMAKGIIRHANRRVLTVPVEMNKPFHQPHLENFFDAIRGKARLNCPAEVGYETAVAVLKVNEAAEAGRKLDFKPAEFNPWQNPA